MKLNKKRLSIIAILILTAGISSVAYASFTVYSPVKGPIHVNYAIALDITGYPKIVATLTNPTTAYPVSGATVILWYYEQTLLGGTPSAPVGTDGWLEWTSNSTNASGVATFAFSPPANGYDYYFGATYYVS
jgi:hypothetical protein